jgi:hypothetical protein
LPHAPGGSILAARLIAIPLIEAPRPNLVTPGMATLARGALRMNVRWLAPLTGAFLVASSSASFAQCETKSMDEDFAYVVKGGIGNLCSTDQEQTKTFCIESGKIASYSYEIVDDKNLVGTTEVRQLDDHCLEAMTAGHAKDASRTPNGWLCGSAERTVLVHIVYCP